MSEIEQYEKPATMVTTNESVTGSSIQQTAIELQDAHKIASAICRTAFVPEHFRGKPEETAVGILYGATVGFDPLTAVQQIFVIGGKPALYARAMVAIAMRAGHDIWTEEEKPGTVTVAGKRAGSDHVSRVTWTTELAKQAGYDKNPKYRSDPRSMLYARASGDVARRIAPDALLGLAYNVEEMQLAGTADVVSRPKATAKDQVRAALTTKQEPAPEESEPTDVTDVEIVPDEPETDVPEKPAPGGITKEQSKKLHASFGELNITERDDRLDYASKVVGHDLGSSADLSKAEASQVIESLVFDLERASEPAEADA